MVHSSTSIAVLPMNSNDASKAVIRPVQRDDHDGVLELIEPFIGRRKLLPRTLEELDLLLPHGFIAELDGRVVGFAALEVYSKKLAEIRSLAVADELQGIGIGKQLVEACVNRAHELNILEVMAISSSETFFRSCGFDYTLPGEKKAFFIQTREEY
jgi:amino-acid N-acetyltransferase